MTRSNRFETDRAARDRSPAPPVTRAAIESAGRPLDRRLRTHLEQAFSDAGIGRAGHTAELPPIAAEPRLDEVRGRSEVEAENSSRRALDGRARAHHPAGGPAPDFSGVRLHDDAIAHRAASAVDAEAYTLGNHIVFGADRFRPGTERGVRLLAHELGHVLQGSGSVARKPRTDGPSDAEARAMDYTRAQDYVTDYFHASDRLLDDAYKCAVNALTEFAARAAGALPGDPAMPSLGLLKLVMERVPGTGEIILAIEVLEKLTSAATEVNTLAGPKIDRGDPLEAASGARTGALGAHLRLREALPGALDAERRRLDGERGASAGETLLQSTRARLGPIPAYSAAVITKVGLEYELELYRAYYSKHAAISRKAPYNLGDYTSYRIVAVPGDVVSRVVKLYRQLSREPKVSIDPRYNPEHAVLVRHLIDLGVPVAQGLPTLGRFGAVVTESELKNYRNPMHTGNDLTQPYKGDRYKEVN